MRLTFFDVANIFALYKEGKIVYATSHGDDNYG